MPLDSVHLIPSNWLGVEEKRRRLTKSTSIQLIETHYSNDVNGKRCVCTTFTNICYIFCRPFLEL